MGLCCSRLPPDVVKLDDQPVSPTDASALLPDHFARAAKEVRATAAASHSEVAAVTAPTLTRAAVEAPPPVAAAPAAAIVSVPADGASDIAVAAAGTLWLLKQQTSSAPGDEAAPAPDYIAADGPIFIPAATPAAPSAADSLPVYRSLPIAAAPAVASPAAAAPAAAASSSADALEEPPTPLSFDHGFASLHVEHHPERVLPRLCFVGRKQVLSAAPRANPSSCPPHAPPPASAASPTIHRGCRGR